VKDVQSLIDGRGVKIVRVGVKHVKMPLSVLVKGGGSRRVLGDISLSVDLPHHFKGTHMSRFLEVLEEWGEKLVSSREIESLLEDLRRRLRADRAELWLKFTYFIPGFSPVSQLPGSPGYPSEFHGILDGGNYSFVLGVDVPVMTLCPCSKEISLRGAHTQRAVIRARIRYFPDTFVWIEDLVSSLESLGSSPIYSNFSIDDERRITESSYDTPRFVEDVLRDAVLLLRSDGRIFWFEVECESQESIHNHSAFAWQEEQVPG
jgi:GTP cyclohydrolase I